MVPLSRASSPSLLSGSSIRKEALDLLRNLSIGIATAALADNPVQRPALRGFVGALQGAQTNGGVFVTTGRFTQGARRFAENVAVQLVLIDGAELTRLKVEHNIGVSVKETFDLKMID